jgi:hypothetical protein
MAEAMRVECVRQNGPVARAVLRWGALAVAVTSAAVLAVPVSSYWLWVAESAFFGIREAAAPKLGVIAVVFAALPLGAAAASWVWCGRRRSSSRVLGFEPRADVPIGNGDRWLTVGAPGQDVELLLEPSGHPAVGPYREALAADGIPLASLAVDDVNKEHDRLVQAGVAFTQPPTEMGPVTTAVFDDTCGNLIQLIAL